MTIPPKTRCGFVSVIGLPNAGKSTLVNALVGQKVSITSQKAQTTRCRILGIVCHEIENDDGILEKSQIIFIDTPGVFDAKQKIERAMVGAAYEALQDSDAILHLIDAGHKNALGRNAIIQEKFPENRPVFLALNKTDAVKKPILLDLAGSFNEAFDYTATFMISALKEKGLDRCLDALAAALPEGAWHYDEDDVTDMPMRMMAAEITREKIFRQLHEELPYAALVETENWEEFDNGDIKIDQIIYIQKGSQKAIVLGKGGSRIKELGTHAREELEDIIGRRVHLKLFVKVQENWPDRPESLRLMGLDTNE